MTRNGIHHVTAIAGKAARNVDFYTRVLGLRLVKKTVNFDDPGTYHLYYGDEVGSPGSILTFFPWDGVRPGRAGVGATEETSFRVPQASIGYWTQRFIERSVTHDAISKRYGETVLTFRDPDGMPLALVAVNDARGTAAWQGSDIPSEHAIRGFHGVTLLLRDVARTGAILTDVFGFQQIGHEGSRLRFAVDGNAIGGIVDLHGVGDFLPALEGGGTVHHVAFRAADDAAQADMVRKVAEDHGLDPTEQLDRNYFRSVYFREPGGVLFEIATDVPGFAVDEPVGTLGQSLKLPSFLEAQRRAIEAVLPEVA